MFSLGREIWVMLIRADKWDSVRELFSYHILAEEERLHQRWWELGSRSFMNVFATLIS